MLPHDLEGTYGDSMQSGARSIHLPTCLATLEKCRTRYGLSGMLEVEDILISKEHRS